MMITENDIGSTVAWRDRQVTVVAVDGDRVCVRDPKTPNPMGIPGIDHFWADASALMVFEPHPFEDLFT